MLNRLSLIVHLKVSKAELKEKENQIHFPLTQKECKLRDSNKSVSSIFMIPLENSYSLWFILT